MRSDITLADIEEIKEEKPVQDKKVESVNTVENNESNKELH